MRGENMNEFETSNDPILESIRQLNSAAPADLKSRLLYECGVAAADARFQRRRRMHNGIAATGFLVAAVSGVLIGTQFSKPMPQMETVRLHPVSPKHRFVRKGNESTLAAAMSMERVFALLDRNNSNANSKQFSLPVEIETPLTTRSILNEL
jgi:hypothetical protein